MRESGSKAKISGMGEGYKCGLMAQDMKGIGRATELVEGED